MKYSLLIFLAILSASSFGSIFHDDDRLEFHQMSKERQAVSESSIALIPKSKLKKVGNKYKIVTKNLKDYLNFCPDSNFSNQLQAANCSGILVKNQYLLTAAHCIDESMKGYGMNDFYAVFNYKKMAQNQNEYFINKEDVFELVKKTHYEFDKTFSSTLLDLAIFKLDRKPNYKSAKVSFKKMNKGDRVYVLGYPLGIALKLSDDSVVTKTVGRKNSFQHQLDTFSVNSGSPIFDEESNVVGVHVRGTGFNYKEYGRSCKDWYKGEATRDYGEANDIRSLKNIYDRL